MKYPILITAAVVIAVSSCKTPYKATDQTGVADSTATTTNSSTMSSSQSATTDTTASSSRTDTSMSTATQSAVDSVRTSPMDSTMSSQAKDSAVTNAPADSARTNPTMDTASAKPMKDSASSQMSMDTAAASQADATGNKLSTDASKSSAKADSSSASTEAPEAVAPAFTKQYPGASNVEWSAYDSLAAVPIDMRLTGWKKMDAEDHMVKFDFKDETHYAWYDDKGKWIGTATPMEDVTKLPAPVKAAVNNAIKTRYNGYAVSKMSKESQTGKKAYEIELAKDDSKVRMLVTSAGKVTQIFKYASDKKD